MARFTGSATMRSSTTVMIRTISATAALGIALTGLPALAGPPVSLNPRAHRAATSVPVLANRAEAATLPGVQRHDGPRRARKKREAQGLLGAGGAALVAAAGFIAGSIVVLTSRDEEVCVEAGLNKTCAKTEKRLSDSRKNLGAGLAGLAIGFATMGGVFLAFGVKSSRELKAVTASVRF